MKKVYVNKIIQKDVEFYSMIVDPRLIAKIRKKYTAGEAQDVQRPWILKKVKEISAYVAGKSKVEGKNSIGLIPNSPILNLKNKFTIKEEEKDEIKCYYIMLPETDSEIKEYEGQLEIIDGQHRIIAFDKEYMDPDFKANTPYEMNFTFFNNISDNQRKEIFMVTNEKQDKVANNLLRYIKKSLGLLVGDDDTMYDLLEYINEETSSPLYHRIAFGANKVQKGYQESQMTKIFNKYGALDFYNERIVNIAQKQSVNPIELFSIVINNYFEAWEEVCNVSFQEPASDTITKISGIRYIMCLFKEISNVILGEGQKLTKENYCKIFKELPEALALENVKFVFCDDSAEGIEDNYERKLAFRGEGGTIELAKKDLGRLKVTHSENKGNIEII